MPTGKTIKYAKVLESVDKLLNPYSAERLGESVVSGEFSAAAHAFNANIIRFTSMCRFPAMVENFAAQRQIHEDIACFNLTGSLTPAEPPSEDALITEMNRIEANFVVTFAPKGSPKKNVDALHLAAANVNAFMSHRKDLRWHFGAESFFGSLLLNAYTAFESLSTDLWVAAVNARPRSLAMNVLTTKSGEPFAGRELQPSILLATLAGDYDFNVRERMGDLLKDRRRVSLESLKSTEDAYRAAFQIPEDAKRRPSQRLQDIFATHRTALNLLEAFRNLIAHKGCRVDQPFLDKTLKDEPGLATMKVNDVVSVDGELVRRLAFPAFHFGRELLKFVDDWLQKYKD